ncbi:MAG TPA: hypothetical protein VMW75_00430, partial [Thermoanaerobaculia bacterium]|nr:hypothetical protein [Thermoanaerobaculia bacterium]
ETAHFAALPSLGPLVPGHTLLCTKEHLRSFAEVGVLGDTICGELETLRLRLGSALEEIYGAPVHGFEHGNGRGSARVLCTVEHAHIHLIPTAVHLWEALSTCQDWKYFEIGGDSLYSHVRDGEYLYYESPERWAAIATAGEFESQYLRRIVAQAVGVPELWNWRANPRAEHAHRGFVELARHEVDTVHVEKGLAHGQVKEVR